jgi:hypothetical protein
MRPADEGPRCCWRNKGAAWRTCQRGTLQPRRTRLPRGLLTSDLRHATSLDLGGSHAAAQIRSPALRPSGLSFSPQRRYNRAMPYPRNLLAGLLASLAGALLLSEMAFAQRSGVRSGVIGNSTHQRIHNRAIGGGYRGAPIGNGRRSGAIRSIHPSLTGLEPLPTFVRPPSAETCQISIAPRFSSDQSGTLASGSICSRCRIE